MTIVSVVGARPNFMKMAPLCAEFARRGLNNLLVHTGQHYDEKMSRVFFDELELPRPDVDLGVGSGSHARQTAEVLMRFDEVLERVNPELVVVAGDVNSTLACALAAVKRHIPVAHVEAGLRSFDRAMPEEINRLLTDQISDLLFTHSPEARDHLLAEGIPAMRIHDVGNIMIDTLLAHLKKAKGLGTLAALGLAPQGYAVATLHRPSNVDDPAILRPLCEALIDISRSLPVVFPVHPRTRARLADFDLLASMQAAPGLTLTEPQGYLDFLALTSQSRLVMTDSGGLQEETTATGVPCLTLRENTERPVTVNVGTNILVGLDPERLKAEVAAIMAGRGKTGRVPEGWDGHTATRIVAVIVSFLAARP
jgi:UDP-N-acetylglucosamine 2-epimerase (non-hydrolysing)